jgi:hypothetical protein
LDLADGIATGRVWIEDLIQKGHESEFGRINALPTVLFLLVGLEQRRIDPVSAKAFQMMERMTWLEGL